MGTPNYMAPEQATDAKNVTGRADVYGFAATVFATLTGRPPFDGTTTTEILVNLATKPAPRLRSIRSDIPQSVDDVVDRCLAKDPAARPPTIVDAWNQLAMALGNSAGTAPQPRAPSHPGIIADAPRSSTTLGASAAQVAASASTAAAGGGGKRKAVIAAAFLVVAGAATGLIVRGGKSSPSSPSATGVVVAASDSNVPGAPLASSPRLPATPGPPATQPEPPAPEVEPPVTQHEQPALDCSWPYFRRVEHEHAGDAKQLTDALARLSDCHAAKRVDDRYYAELHKELDSLLAKATARPGGASSTARVPACDAAHFDQLAHSGSTGAVKRGLAQLRSCKSQLSTSSNIPQLARKAAAKVCCTDSSASCGTVTPVWPSRCPFPASRIAPTTASRACATPRTPRRQQWNPRCDASNPVAPNWTALATAACSPA